MNKPEKPSTTLRRLRNELALMEATAAIAHGQARRQLLAIARDLAPKAAGYARRGRPRLLAVLAKIVADPRLRPRTEAYTEKISRDLRRKKR